MKNVTWVIFALFGFVCGFAQPFPGGYGKSLPLGDSSMLSEITMPSYKKTSQEEDFSYAEDFEGVHGFVVDNGSQANKWVVGTATSNGGMHALYVSNDGGKNNAYNINSASTVHAWHDIQMPAAADELTLSFDWHNNGQASNDFIRVWVVPATFTPVAGALITDVGSGGRQIGGNYYGASDYNTVTAVVNVSAYAGGLVRLVFEWRNNAINGSQPPGAIDNISLVRVACPPPTALAQGTVTDTSVALSWTAPASVTPTYDYYYAVDATGPTDSTAPLGTTATTSAMVTGLTRSTTYYVWVRSNCGNGSTSTWTGPIPLTTTQIAATLPYSQDFEGAPGWAFSNETTANKWMAGNSTSKSPAHSLYISGDDSNYNYNVFERATVHAYRDIAIPAGTVEINVGFNWKCEGEANDGFDYDYMSVWFVPVTYKPTSGMEITAANSGGVQIGAVFDENPNWSLFSTTVNVSKYAGLAGRLVFEWTNDANEGSKVPAAIDDVSIAVVTCLQPVDVTVSDVTETTAILKWTNRDGAAAWEIFVMPKGTVPNAQSTGTTVTTPSPYTITNLTPGMVYDCYIRAICGPGNVSLWSGPVAVTALSPCAVPGAIALSCPAQDGGTFTWVPGGTESSWQVAIVPEGSPLPVTGSRVNTASYTANGLLKSTNYTFYVRAVCPNGLGNSTWTGYNFTTPDTSIINGIGVCSPPGIALVYPNSSNSTTTYGQVGCLDQTPNPTWYFVKIGTPNDTMTFQITQNTLFDANGNPDANGKELDVDFVAYGPFTSKEDACARTRLVYCPECKDNTEDPAYYPHGAIVDCSYSEQASETLTIHNPKAGEYYAVLVTNYSQEAGFITFVQTSAGGSTDCNVAYAVNLGGDQKLCGNNAAAVTAMLSVPVNSQPAAYQWLIDGKTFTPTVLDTQTGSQTIQVTQPGSHIYSVVVTIPGSENSSPITDDVTIVLAPDFVLPAPAPILLCGSNGTAQVIPAKLYGALLGTLDRAVYEVGGIYTSESNAAADISAIDPVLPFSVVSGQTLYAVIRYSNAPQCFRILAFTVSITTLVDAAISYSTPFCADSTAQFVTQGGNSGGSYSAPQGLNINAATGTINPSVSTPGHYTVTYTIAATASCPEFKAYAQVEVLAAPAATIAYGASPYCSGAGSAPVTQTGTANGVYTATAGLVINAATGTIDLAASTPGTYTVTYTFVSACGIPAPATTKVVISPVPAVALLQSCMGTEYTLEVSFDGDSAFNPDNVNFEWATLAGAPLGANAPRLVVTKPGTYVVTVTPADGQECPATAKVIVDDATCTIQRGISPGDANDNNEFDLTALNVIRLTIFNRYGREVYSYNGLYTTQWHGQENSGSELPTGTYFYTFDSSDGKTRTGWVYINRAD